MTVARSVADVLDGHVTLEFEFVDRMHQRRRRPVLPGRLRGRRRGALRRQGPGEDDRLSYREASEPLTDKSYPCWIVQTTVSVNHYHFYCVDSDFGPLFIRFRSRSLQRELCRNGNEWAKRQATMAGIALEPYSGFLSCEDPERLKRVCAASGPMRSTASCASGCTTCPDPFSGPLGRLSLRRLDPPGRILSDPDPRPAFHKAGNYSSRR